jgi:exopolysaccharide biosynthesis polyprenyl glycosylphosphotransferase
MGPTLALVEAGLLATVVSAAALYWTPWTLQDPVELTAVLGQALAMAICCIVAFYYNDLYDLRVVRSFGAFAVRLVQALGVAFMLLAGFYHFFPDTQLASGPFLSSIVLIAGLVLPLRAVSYVIMRSRPFRERVLILGTGSLAADLVAEIRRQPHFRYVVVGMITDAPNGALTTVAGIPILGSIDHIGDIVRHVMPGRIVTTLSERRGHLPVRELLEARFFHGAVVEDGVDVYERLTGKLAIERLRPSSLLFAQDVHRYRMARAMARGLSFAMALVALVLTAPLGLLISLVIWLDSGGPVLFRHARLGLRGRSFELIKFRTMRPASSASEWARDNECRITRVGAWLRRFRLDELPQFVNILRGDMNLVGPRPHPVTNQTVFEAHIPYYALRMLVRPGVTGWAQIRQGYANDLSEETDKMRYDLYYIKHFSLGLDVRILVDTVKIVLFGRGARAADAYQPGQPAKVAAR